ncbi:MAG: hypothetical protein FJ088_13060, partial [Deltaproteobacteria bacterium]|nr:hypothetical protein [Deltaproteobacteria bacterium]
NSSSDSVIKIDAKTQDVTLIEVGDNPTILKTIPKNDAAVVLNSGSDSVSVIWSSPTSDEVKTLDVEPGCNMLVMSPDGRYAVAYYDNSFAKPGDPVGSFQVISIVKLSKGAEKVINLSVGFRPLQIEFSSDGLAAFAITEDGISRITLDEAAADSIVPPIPVSDDPAAKLKEGEVKITPDGKFALARDPYKAEITIVDILGKVLYKVELAGIPTDLDLTPDGEKALIVERDALRIEVLEIPEILGDTEARIVIELKNQNIGLAKITEDGSHAILYSSLEEVEELSTLRFADFTMKSYSLKKSVDSVLNIPSHKRAVVIHRKKPGNPVPGEDVEDFIDKSYGFSLFDIESGFVKLEITGDKTGETAFIPGGIKAYMALPDGEGISHKVLEINTVSFMVKSFILGSEPEHIRSVPASNTVAVSQKHPSGRITFIDVTTGNMKTITGFELNGLID